MKIFKAGLRVIREGLRLIVRGLQLVGEVIQLHLPEVFQVGLCVHQRRCVKRDGVELVRDGLKVGGHGAKVRLGELAQGADKLFEVGVGVARVLTCLCDIPDGAGDLRQGCRKVEKARLVYQLYDCIRKRGETFAGLDRAFADGVNNPFQAVEDLCKALIDGRDAGADGLNYGPDCSSYGLNQGPDRGDRLREGAVQACERFHNGGDAGSYALDNAGQGSADLLYCRAYAVNNRPDFFQQAGKALDDLRDVIPDGGYNVHNGGAYLFDNAADTVNNRADFRQYVREGRDDFRKL